MAQTELVDKDLEDKYGELIPNELNETKQHYINELNTLLENYQPSDKILMFTIECIISIAIFAIGLSIGLVGLLIITILAMFIIVKLGGSFAFKNASFKEEELAYKACIIMDFLIDIQEGTYHSYNGVHIIHTGTGRHLNLYNKFVRFYPALASKKLKRLASIDVKDELN